MGLAHLFYTIISSLFRAFLDFFRHECAYADAVPTHLHGIVQAKNSVVKDLPANTRRLLFRRAVESIYRISTDFWTKPPSLEGDVIFSIPKIAEDIGWSFITLLVFSFAMMEADGIVSSP